MSFLTNILQATGFYGNSHTTTQQLPASGELRPALRDKPKAALPPNPFVAAAMDEMARMQAVYTQTERAASVVRVAQSTVFRALRSLTE